MKRITIKYFKEKHQERITLVRVLIDFQLDLRLKIAKDLLDNMLDGVPIRYDISNDKLSGFLETLETLKLEYEVN
jgi:hypothetical protein